MDENPLGWMEEDGELTNGAAITVIRDGDLNTVLEAFGAEGGPLLPAGPEIEAWAWGDDGPRPWAVIAKVAEGVVVVEPNGYIATRPTVLDAISRNALAVAVYWSINLDTDAEIAENGAVVGGIREERPHGNERFIELAAPLGIPGDDDDFDPFDTIAWGLRAQSQIAGMSLTEEMWKRFREQPCAYLLIPALPEHYPDRYSINQEISPLSEIADHADQSRVRDLVWHAASLVAGEAADRPEIARVLSARGFDETTEPIARRAVLGIGPEARLWDTLHYATNPDATSALLQVLLVCHLRLERGEFVQLLSDVRNGLTGGPT